MLKNKDKNPGVEAIQAFCRSQIAPYKVPRLIEFREELPKTLVGKVLRRKLREESEHTQLVAQKRASNLSFQGLVGLDVDLSESSVT